MKLKSSWISKSLTHKRASKRTVIIANANNNKNATKCCYTKSNKSCIRKRNDDTQAFHGLFFCPIFRFVHYSCCESLVMPSIHWRVCKFSSNSRYAVRGTNEMETKQKQILFQIVGNACQIPISCMFPYTLHTSASKTPWSFARIRCRERGKWRGRHALANDTL